MRFRAQGIQTLLKSMLLFVSMLSSLAVIAGPKLVTPQLHAGVTGQAYSATLFIGSVLPLTSASVTGLPAGLTATHNGSGTLAISGTPTIAGAFTVNVTATDNATGALNIDVSIVII